MSMLSHKLNLLLFIIHLKHQHSKRLFIICLIYFYLIAMKYNAEKEKDHTLT